VFGAGGGTSSYEEIEEADVILLWGSNAREAHPLFFHHLLKGLDNGARMFAIDPRRTSSAKFADTWVGLSVGTDIALANAMGREIIRAGQEQPALRTGRCARQRLQRDDVARLITAAGGGYGDPLQREPAHVAADVREGHLSAALARSSYGVVLQEGAVDEAATAALRAGLAQERDREA